MFTIAQIFRISLQTLISVNRHIPDPNFIFPGDVLCVPARVTIPCCVVLQERIATLPFGTSAAAFIHFDFAGTQAVSFVATLPAPSTFGNFNSYIGEVLIPEINGFGNELFQVQEEPPTWATTISLPTVASLSPQSTVRIRPTNTETGIDGPVILETSLAECR